MSHFRFPFCRWSYGCILGISLLVLNLMLLSSPNFDLFLATSSEIMTIVEISQEDCEKCKALVAILDLPPWKYDEIHDIISSPRTHATWCHRRAKYELYKSEGGGTMPDKKFIEEVVKAHNEYRSKHQAPSISHAKDLTDYAQKWADHLVATNSFAHSSCDHKGQRLGENIAMKWSSSPGAYTGQEVTDQWYSEIKDHTFGTEPRSLKSGHFTQVVWKESVEIGVGKATAKDGKTIVVASYRPAGNMMGKFAVNVLPPKDGKIIVPVDQSKMNSGGGTPFSSRLGGEDPFGGARGGGGTEKKTTRTYTTTEGSGPNAVTKTIVEETIIKPDGSKVTTKKETVTTGDAATSAFKDDDQFSRLSLQDGAPQSAQLKSSASTQKKPPQKMSDFIDEAVKVHNDLRKKHGADKLKHSKDLSEYAQKWAEHLAATDKFEHSDCNHKGDRLGENICCKWSSLGADYTGKEACEQWYSELSKHDFSRETRAPGSGHFTQMVWKGSKEMGIGKAKTAGGKCIVVANYKPAGNVLGHFLENVSPPKN